MWLTINALTFCPNTCGGPPDPARVARSHACLHWVAPWQDQRNCAWKICPTKCIEHFAQQVGHVVWRHLSDCPSKKQNILSFIVVNLVKAQLKRPKRLQHWIKQCHHFCWLPSWQWAVRHVHHVPCQKIQLDYVYIYIYIKYINDQSDLTIFAINIAVKHELESWSQIVS